MSLNDIQLTDHQLVDLYPGVLVQTSNTSAVPELQPLRFLGKNEKHILIIVTNQNHAFLSDGALSFLTNILTACKLSLADVAIINRHALASSELANAFDTLQPKKVLLIDTAPLEIDLPINFPMFQLQAFNKVKYLYTPSLSALESEQALKKTLWSCLKTLFNIQ